MPRVFFQLAMLLIPGACTGRLQRINQSIKPRCCDSTQPYAGTVIFSRWPTEQVHVPQDPLFLGKLMAVKTHKPRARSVLPLNCYLPAANAAKAADTAAAAFEWAASIGEQWGMTGDFSLTKEHWPMGAALATELLFDWMM